MLESEPDQSFVDAYLDFVRIIVHSILGLLMATRVLVIFALTVLYIFWPSLLFIFITSTDPNATAPLYLPGLQLIWGFTVIPASWALISTKTSYTADEFLRQLAGTADTNRED